MACMCGALIVAFDPIGSGASLRRSREYSGKNNIHMSMPIDRLV